MGHIESISCSPCTSNMHQFNDIGGGCFHANSKVKMFDGSFKLAKNIKPGDYIYGLNINGENKASKVNVFFKLSQNLSLLKCANWVS